MRHPFFYALAALVLSASAAMAQAIPGLLPAGDIPDIVRAAGYMPLSPAMLRGDRYVLRASTPDGREMRVIVRARSGEIVSASPVVPAGPAGERLGAYERMDVAPGYVPPPIMHDNDGPMARPGAPIPGVPPRTARVAPVPEAPEYVPPPYAGPPGAPREERGEHGLLPPPPDRFPPRATAPAPAERPAAKPAPVKRAAATPLPKPRPPVEAGAPSGSTADSPPAASATPSQPPAAVPSAAPPPAKVDPRSLPH